MPPEAPQGEVSDAPMPGTRPRGRALSEILQDIAADTSRDRIAVGDILAAMRDRAIAALMLIFALPNVLPMPPGTSSILGAPLIFLAAQLTFGLRPWLPRVIAERSIARSDFAILVRRAAPWLARAERLLRPRLGALARPPFEYLVGLSSLVMALVLFLPIPLGNMLPALSICLYSLGILERDGAWILAGLLAGLAGLALVWGVLYALIGSALFIFANAFA